MNIAFAHAERPLPHVRARTMAGFVFAARWALGLVLGCTHAACASVNQTPLSDAAKLPRLSYLYGPAEEGTVALDQPTEESSGLEMADNDSDLDEEDEEDTSDDLDVSVVVADDEDEDEDEGSDASPAVLVGTYKGTDWVTITLPGLPDDEQVDDQARVVLAALDKPDRYSFAVLDTRTGDELCKIVGTAKNSLLTFDEEQTCFDGILGIPMEASLVTGIATIDGETLSVSLSVELSVSTPNGELSGDLDYRFEGKKQ